MNSKLLQFLSPFPAGFSMDVLLLLLLLFYIPSSNYKQCLSELTKYVKDNKSEQTKNKLSYKTIKYAWFVNKIVNVITIYIRHV